jgi:hypothetical protein
MLNPMNTIASRNLAAQFVEHLARHLRPPVEQAADERDQRSTHHHVVEVGDDEVGVVQVQVDRQRPRNRPVSPPIVNRR